jgi:hypothetical protein
MVKFTSLFLGVALMLAAGCQSMGAKKDDTSMPDNKGVAAVTNQGAVVYLAGQGAEMKTLSASGTTICPQCRMDADNYFKTGMLTEKCSVCGANRYPLMRGK